MPEAYSVGGSSCYSVLEARARAPLQRLPCDRGPRRCSAVRVLCGCGSEHADTHVLHLLFRVVSGHRLGAGSSCSVSADLGQLWRRSDHFGAISAGLGSIAASSWQTSTKLGRSRPNLAIRVISADVFPSAANLGPDLAKLEQSPDSTHLAHVLSMPSPNSARVRQHRRFRPKSTRSRPLLADVDHIWAPRSAAQATTSA